MSKPADKEKGVIFNIDLTGKIKDTTVDKFAFFLNILIGTDVYSNDFKIYGCEDQIGGAVYCKDSAHYTKLIGTLELEFINQVKIATLSLRKKDADLVSVKFNTANAVDIKFLPDDKTKIFIFIKACTNGNCDVKNDFYVGAIYSYICKNIYLINLDLNSDQNNQIVATPTDFTGCKPGFFFENSNCNSGKNKINFKIFFFFILLITKNEYNTLLIKFF